MSSLGRIVTTVFCATFGTLMLMALYARFVGLEMTPAAWAFAGSCPMLVSTPVAILLVRQGEDMRRLNEDLRLAYASLSRVASTDELTGLANRRAFLEVARNLDRSGDDWLLIADIDHFKSINDRFGHERGDAFLRASAEVLRQVAGHDHVVGRLGGEEFAMIIRGTRRDEAVALADRIRREIAAISLVSDDGAAIATTVSIGLAACTPGAAPTDDFKRADHALYRAKARGRNQVRVHTEPAERSPLPLAMAS